MGTVYRKTRRRPLPAGAERFEKSGQPFARWRVNGKVKTAIVVLGGDGEAFVQVKRTVWTARYRDHADKVVERSTGCRDEQAARHTLAGWEREVEQLRSGILDAGDLAAARGGSLPLEDSLAAYDRSLVAAGVTNTHHANVLAAVRRLAVDCAFVTLAKVKREAVENWLADRSDAGMSARSRNRYRAALVGFLNWCRDSGRVPGHDLAKLPKADERADPRRQRRAMTEAELTRLLAVSAERPLIEARTVRRGKRKGEAFAAVKAATVDRLRALGRERALIYKTLVLTGLRVDELRTLTVGELDLTPGAERLKLKAAREKNREGNTLPIRADLAADLRSWLADRGPLTHDALVLKVPAGLVRILNRDLKAAGILKRDDRGRTLDVHALRTTFGTLLSSTGAMPRVAQAAMRHSDITLTMGVYTDPRLLGIREAVDRLPGLPLDIGRAGGPAACPTKVTATGGNPGQNGSTDGKTGRSSGNPGRRSAHSKNATNSSERPPVTSGVTGGHDVGVAGFEPTTSCSQGTGRGNRNRAKPSLSQGITNHTERTVRTQYPRLCGGCCKLLQHKHPAEPLPASWLPIAHHPTYDSAHRSGRNSDRPAPPVRAPAGRVRSVSRAGRAACAAGAGPGRSPRRTCRRPAR